MNTTNPEAYMGVPILTEGSYKKLWKIWGQNG